MQRHRFGETDSIAVDHHVLVLVNRDVAVSVSHHIPFAIGRQRTSRRARFIEPLPVLQGRVHICSRRHALRTKAAAGRVRSHSRVAHRRVCPSGGGHAPLCGAPRRRFCIDVRAALNLLALRCEGQSEVSNAY